MDSNIRLLIASFLIYFSLQATNWTAITQEVQQIINSEFNNPITNGSSMSKALQAYAKEIDPYAQVLGPAEYRELLDTVSGGFYGIGLELQVKQESDPFLVVKNVSPESPAEKAGILPEDKILTINAKSVAGLSTHESIRKLRSEKRYAPLKLTIHRNKTDLLALSLRRELIQEKKCTCSFIKEHRILQCKIPLFTKRTAQELETFLRKATKKPKGLILDLRDNPGGLLQAAVDCAALFLPKKSLVVSTKNRAGKIIERYYTTKAPIVQDIPIALLVNENTASAAEILAGTLRMHHGKNLQVIIVGTRTLGKGSVQEVKPLSNNCALKITTAYYYLVDGSSVEQKGVIPDVIINRDSASIKNQDQSQQDNLLICACTYLEKMRKTNSSKSS